MNRSIDLVCIVAIALTAVAIPVFATASESTAVVRYATAELASTASIARLHTRLSGAAQQVCMQYSGSDPAHWRLYNRCVKQSLAAAVERVHSPALNAYHEAKTGEHVGATELAIKLAGQPLPMGVRNR
jgi:UrcA family protein